MRQNFRRRSSTSAPSRVPLAGSRRPRIKTPSNTSGIKETTRGKKYLEKLSQRRDFGKRDLMA